jgi:aryl-alcohol dehydrogenase-like predicted oxidoreductase
MRWDTSDTYGDSEELIGKWYVGSVTGVILCENLLVRQVQTNWQEERNFSSIKVWDFL